MHAFLREYKNVLIHIIAAKGKEDRNSVLADNFLQQLRK